MKTMARITTVFIFLTICFCSFSQGIVEINIDTTIIEGISRLNLGITHTHKTWEGSSVDASKRAKALLMESCKFQNQHIMGWGAGNPNPSKGTYSWSSLDARVDLMRSLPAEKIITFCTAPGWMKVSGNDWDMESRVKDENIPDFAGLCKKIALRYPDVKYFHVWNELKGYWSSSLGNWDYVSFSNLYNAVWDSVKSVRPDALIGGPYIPIQGDGSVEIGKIGNNNFVPISTKDMKFITEWWSRKKGVDFICFDRWLVDPKNTASFTQADKMKLTKHFGLVTRQLRRIVGDEIPIFVSEYYGGSDPDDLKFTAANYASCYLHSILDLTDVALNWNPEQGEVEGYLYTSTKTATGGQAVDHYAVFKNINTYFGKGTELVQANSSDENIEVLASRKMVMLINKNATPVSVKVFGKVLTLTGYEVRFVNYDSRTSSLTSSGSTSMIPPDTNFGAKLDIDTVGPQDTYALPTSNFTLIKTTDNATNVIASGVEGQVFVFEKGIHYTCINVSPKKRMKFFGQKGAILDGGGSTATNKYCFNVSTGGGIIANLDIRNYKGGAAQDACVNFNNVAGGWSAVYSNQTANPADGWLLENLYVHDNGFVGVFLGGYTTIRSSDVSYNGHVGVKATGFSPSIRSNHIHHNNAANFDTGWESGGSKIWCTQGITIENNIYEDNNGPGIWFDYNYDGNVIRNNTLINNSDSGITLEMVGGNPGWYKTKLGRDMIVTIVENNLIKQNGWSVAGSNMVTFPTAIRDIITKQWNYQFWKTKPGDVNWMGGGLQSHDGGPAIIRNNKLVGNYGGAIMQYQKRGEIDVQSQQNTGHNGPKGTLVGSVVEKNYFDDCYGFSGFRFVRNEEGTSTLIQLSDFMPERDGVIFQGNIYNIDSTMKYFRWAYDNNNGSTSTSMRDYYEKPLLTLPEWKSISKQDIPTRIVIDKDENRTN